MHKTVSKLARVGLCAAVCLAAPLAACTMPEAPPLPQMTFANYQQLPINVSAINVHVQEDNTGGAFIADPAEVAKRYVNARFAPRGGMGSLDVTIEQATVKQSEKKAEKALPRYLNVGGQDVYDVTLRVRFEHTDNGIVKYGKVFTAQRQMYISEHASVAEREQHELEGLEKMFSDLDREVSHTVVEDMRLGLQ